MLQKHSFSSNSTEKNQLVFLKTYIYSEVNKLGQNLIDQFMCD